MREGDEYLINGTKSLITTGGIVGLYTVFRTVDRQKGLKGVTAIVVPGNMPGLSGGTKEKKMVDRAWCVGEVIFDRVRVAGANRLGDEGEGF